MHSWYAYVTHTCLDVATKTKKTPKKMHSWYAYVTHTCLDAATKTRKLQKKCIHDMLMLRTHV